MMHAPPERDIAAITINRWSHGYSYYANSLVDDEDEADGLVETAGAPFGRIVFAGADRDWDPYLHASIDSAARAVDEAPEG
jgi:spermidine dehydrogenase